MKIFIFGASGYLGSRLVEYLKAEHEVYALVRTSSSLGRLAGKGYHIVSGVEKKKSLTDAFKRYNPDLIVNTAALYGRKGESLAQLVQANILFPTLLYELCGEYGVKCFINTGTSLPDDVSPYALTKNAFVKLANSELSESLKFINVVLEHFYGPGDDCSKFTSHVIKACMEGKELNLTEGLQERDFIYIDDVLSAYRVILSNLNQISSGEEIGLGSGVSVRIRDVVNCIKKITGSKSRINFGAIRMRRNEKYSEHADVRKLNSLGWVALETIESGMKKYYETVYSYNCNSNL